LSELFAMFLKLSGRKALVVGGGTIATLRVKQLLRAKAAVTVVAPEVSTEIENCLKAGSIALIRRKFEPTDLTPNFYMVIAATDDPAVQTAVARHAQRHGTLLNVVDSPRLSNFYTPAVVKRGDLMIAVGTGGRSPFLAGKVREWLDQAIPKNAADLATTMERLRTKLKIEIPHDLDKQKELMSEFAEGVFKK